MTNQLESDLRDALAAHVSHLPDGAEERLTGIDYHPRTSRIRPRVMVGSMAGVAATTGVVVSTVVLAGSPPAFAGWLPSPTPATAGQMSSADATCRAQLADSPALTGLSPVNGWNQTATDVRGPFTLVVYKDGSAVATCLTGPSITIVSRSTTTGGVASGVASVSHRAGAAIGGASSGSVTVGGSVSVGGSASGSGSITHTSVVHLDSSSQGPFTLVEGQVKPGVTAVTLLRSDGQSVQSTTANGWFVAWWPGSETTSSAEVTTAGGVSTQSLDLPPSFPPVGATCQPSSSTASPAQSCSGHVGGGGTGGPSTSTRSSGGPSLNTNG